MKTKAGVHDLCSPNKVLATELIKLPAGFNHSSERCSAS